MASSPKPAPDLPSARTDLLLLTPHRPIHPPPRPNRGPCHKQRVPLLSSSRPLTLVCSQAHPNPSRSSWEVLPAPYLRNEHPLPYTRPLRCTHSLLQRGTGFAGGFNKACWAGMNIGQGARKARYPIAPARWGGAVGQFQVSTSPCPREGCRNVSPSPWSDQSRVTWRELLPWGQVPTVPS